MNGGFLGYFPLGTVMYVLAQFTTSAGVPTDATGSPAFRVYHPSTATAKTTGTASLFDAGSTDGLYQLSLTPSILSGYESGETYFIRVTATVSAVAQVRTFSFTVL